MFSSKEFRTIARDKLRGKWGRSVLVSFIAALLGAETLGNAGSYVTESATESAAAGVDIMEGLAASMSDMLNMNITASALTGVFVGAGLISIVLFFVSAAVSLGYGKYYIDLVLENRAGSVGVLFDRFDIFFKAVGLKLYMGLFIVLWSLLLFVPGIIAAYRYSMAPYIMAEHPEIGVREAVNMSKQMMAGHKGRLFGLLFSFIGWALLCTITLGIGNLWLNPYVRAAEAAFYIERTGRGIPMAEPCVK